MRNDDTTSTFEARRNARLFLLLGMIGTASVTAACWVYLVMFTQKRSAILAVCDKYPSIFSDNTGCEKESQKISCSAIIANNSQAVAWFNHYNDGTVLMTSLQEDCVRFIANNCGVLNRFGDSYQALSDNLWQLVAKCDPVSTRNIILIVAAAVGTTMFGILTLCALRSCLAKEPTQSHATNTQSLLSQPNNADAPVIVSAPDTEDRMQTRMSS